MLADQLVTNNFCSNSDEADATLCVMTFPYWLYYHFGGRSEEEICTLFAHGMRPFGLQEEEGVSYIEIFSRLSPSDLFICWQEVIAHA